MLVVGLLTLEMELPVTFKFGVNKGRIWYTVIFGVLVGVGTALGSLVGINMYASTVPERGKRGFWGLLVLLAFAVAGMFVSVKLSIRFYEKREF